MYVVNDQLDGSITIYQVKLIEMNYEERIKKLISKNNRLGRANIKLNQTLKERDATINNQTHEINRLKNKVGELEDRLMRMYTS